MFGQPASSQTVCSPSRRTSDLSSVYSGPVLSRVLIHSGLRSIGTWLLRTSRRRSLRPLGPIGEPGSVVGAAVSVMTCTVPPADDRPGPSAGLVPGRCRPLASGVLLGLLAAVGQRGAGGTGGAVGGGRGVRPRVAAARALGDREIRARGGGAQGRVGRADAAGLGDVAPVLVVRAADRLVDLGSQVVVERRGVTWRRLGAGDRLA